MPPTTEVYPESIDNQIDDVDDDEDSSSEEENERFGFWGAGSGSSSSLSKYMAKREKEAAKELKKQVIKRDMELKRENSKKDVAADPKKETVYVNAPAPQVPEMPRMNSVGSGEFTRQSSNSRNEVNQPALRHSQDLNTARREDHSSRSLHASQNIGRSGDVRSSRDESLGHSEEFVNRGQPIHAESNGYSNGYPAQHQAPITSLQREFLQREFFDAEPELPDSISAAKIMRRIGAYRNWSENEIQADLNALEYHRLRTIKDMRDLSSDGWKEIKELLPLVKDLLIKEISRGRSVSVNRGGDSQQQAGNYQGSYNTVSDQNSNFDLKNIKAPTSTPMDTPDFNANRKNFQPRNTAW